MDLPAYSSRREAVDTGAVDTGVTGVEQPVVGDVLRTAAGVAATATFAAAEAAAAVELGDAVAAVADAAAAVSGLGRSESASSGSR